MFTAILWDYDGTLANTPVKNIAVTRAVLGRLDPALLDPLPEALSSLAAYQAANYRWRNWRELYQHALRVPADRLDEAGALWGPCQLADRTLPPLFGGLLEVLPRLAALAPMGICSQNDSGNIRAALAAHGAADCFAAVVGHADVDFARQKPDPAAFLACLDRLGLKHNVPQGTYFVLLDISDFLALDRFRGWSDLEFCEWMIREIGVAAVPGSSFFREPVNHLIRLHFARSEETLEQALDRLAKLAALLH